MMVQASTAAPTTAAPSTPVPSFSPTATPYPTPEGFRDNDKDGVADAAADGTCCAQCQACAFSDCSGATDFAGTASCCPAGFHHRYHIGYGGQEDTTAYDCVSFVAQADCTAFWTAANCPHTTSSTVVDAAAPRAVGLLALVALLFSA